MDSEKCEVKVGFDSNIKEGSQFEEIVKSDSLSMVDGDSVVQAPDIDTPILINRSRQHISSTDSEETFKKRPSVLHFANCAVLQKHHLSVESNRANSDHDLNYTDADGHDLLLNHVIQESQLFEHEAVSDFTGYRLHTSDRFEDTAPQILIDPAVVRSVIVDFQSSSSQSTQVFGENKGLDVSVGIRRPLDFSTPCVAFADKKSIMADSEAAGSSHHGLSSELSQIRQNIDDLQQELEGRFRELRNSQDSQPSAPSRYDRNQVPSQTLNFPSFSGDNNDDFSEWRFVIEKKLQFLKWSDRTFLTFLPTILTGRAGLYYEQLDHTALNTTAKALDALNDKFGVGSKSFLTKCILYDRVQGVSESVSDYAKAVLKNMIKLNIKDEGQRMSIFLKGLKPNLRMETLKFRPDSLSEMEDIAISIENSIPLTNDSAQYKQLLSAITELSTAVSEVKGQTASIHMLSNNQQTPKPDNTFEYATAAHSPSSRFDGRVGAPLSPFCSRCAVRHPFGQHVVQFEGNYRPRQVNPNTNYGNRGVNFQGNRFPGPQRNRNVMKCYQCGMTGHVARFCRKNITPQNFLDTRGTQQK